MQNTELIAILDVVHLFVFDKKLVLKRTEVQVLGLKSLKPFMKNLINNYCAIAFSSGSIQLGPAKTLLLLPFCL